MTVKFALSGALVAIKTDLKQRRVISTKQGRELASSKGLEYFECSAVSQISFQSTLFKYQLVSPDHVYIMRHFEDAKVLILTITLK